MRRPAASLVSPHPCIAPRRSSSRIQGTVLDPGLWKSLLPVWLREKKPKSNAQGLHEKDLKSKAQGRQRQRNPAAYFMVMFVLVGSMSIHMITLRNDAEHHRRRSTARIELLQEVIERLRNGEDVDVERVLGTGDAQREADWEEGKRRAPQVEPVLTAVNSTTGHRTKKCQAQAPGTGRSGVIRVVRDGGPHRGGDGRCPAAESKGGWHQ